MPTYTQQRVYDLFRRMLTNGLAAVKQLFWTELNYDRTNVRIKDLKPKFGPNRTTSHPN